MRFHAVSIVIALALVSASEARATGFGVARFAGEHGHPTTDNATAAYFNPAALSLSNGAHLFLDANFAYRRLTYDRPPQPSDVPAPPDAADANTGQAALSNFLIGPTLAASARLNDFSFGLIACVPFGAPVHFEQREKYAHHPRLPGPVDGVSRWHSIDGVFVTGQLAAAAAYRLAEPRLAFGLSLSLMHSVLNDVRARADGTNDVEQEGRSLIEASGSAVAGGVGLLWEASRETLWLGASYQSRPNFAGGMKLEGEVQNLLGTEVRADVDVTYDLPDIIRLGARYRPARRIELRLFGDYTRWSAFERQCVAYTGRDCVIQGDGSAPAGGAVLQNIRRDWQDAVEVRAGFSYFPSADFEFFSGLGASSSAVPDATFEAGLPDFPGASFALGGKLALSESVSLASSLTHLVFAPRHVEGELAEDELPTRQPDASGTYKQLATVLNVNLDWQL